MSGIIFPDIDPVALELGPLVIRWYALAYLAGFILGWRYCLRLVGLDTAQDKNVRPNVLDIDDFLAWAVLGVVLGGRIGYVLFYQPEYYLSHPVEIAMVWQGGMSFHGGTLGAVAAMFIYASRRGFHPVRLADFVAVVAPIGLFFGRIANFMNAELFGRPTDLPWGVVFPRGGDLPRHPSQLYEALLEGVLLFIIMAVLVRRDTLRNRTGFLSGVFLCGYALSRMAVETVREPDPQLGLYLDMFTMGQILSLPMFLLGLGLVVFALRRAPAIPPSKPAPQPERSEDKAA